MFKTIASQEYPLREHLEHHVLLDSTLLDAHPSQAQPYGVLHDSAANANAGIDFPKLYRDVDQTRRTGIGMNFEESEDAVAALGVVGGQLAALNIAMPMTRCARQDAKRLSAQLSEPAAEFRNEELQV